MKIFSEKLSLKNDRNNSILITGKQMLSHNPERKNSNELFATYTAVQSSIRMLTVRGSVLVSIEQSLPKPYSCFSVAKNEYQ